MKKLAMMMMMMAVCLTGMANDGVYYVNGSQLVPAHDTNIAITKEVLSIDLNDDGFARVDVQYEFDNRGGEEMVTMGFEAMAPYNDGEKFNPGGRHPHIFDFSVVMNGEQVQYKNALMNVDDTSFTPLDMKIYRPSEYMEEGDGNQLINTKTKELVDFAYSYYFQARFKPGKNVIHHTYRYRMSNGVGRAFEVPYWLTPALRWANHQIDDFTLRISTPTFKHFWIEQKVFQGGQFNVISGKGKTRVAPNVDMEGHYEIALWNGTVEWHKRNFVPSDNFAIISADTYTMWDDKFPSGYFYDRSDTYYPRFDGEYSEDMKRIMRNLPYANRGYVFKDKKLQDYFNKIWWYTPDPSWKQDTSDFTEREWRLIKGE